MNWERLVEITAYNLHGACLVGNPAPKVAAMYERMKSPQVGDLVLEISTIWDPERVGTRLGRLLRHVREPVYTPEEWGANGGGDDPIPTESIWYIELADGREYRWHNASFIAVFTEIEAYGRPLVCDTDAVRSLMGTR